MASARNTKVSATDRADTRDQATTAALPSISLPKGGGAIRGIGEKFAANPATGTGSITVPLAVSPGRSGFGPQLSLSYDSGSGNGPFGFGWNLSIPAITRKTDKGAPQYLDAEESDVYILSGAEDLVPVLEEDGTRFEDDTTVPGYTIHRYRPRVEGLFARIERWTEGATGDIRWRSITRENVTTLYGRDNDSRVFDPAEAALAHPTRIFSWLICASYDDKGNAIVYDYEGEDETRVDTTQANERNRTRAGQRYLKRIRYGNSVSRLIQPDLTQLDYLFEVVFDYDEGHVETLPLDPRIAEATQHRFVRASSSTDGKWAVRPDPFSSYRSGFEVRTYRRCRDVLMFHHFAELGAEPCLVRSTEFDYQDLDTTQPLTVDAELSHSGSTRFASFIRSITQSGFVRDTTRPVLQRNGVRYVPYLKKSLPPLEFEYSKASIQDEICELDGDSLENLPTGVDGSTFHWVDLDGEGISGIFTEQANAWFYKPNLGQGRFGPVQTLPTRPTVSIGSRGTQLLDLSGDGQLDVVAFEHDQAGFFERTESEWESFRAFENMPNIRWNEPNLRFVDLNGDGHADILITEQDVFTWYPSLEERGFGPSNRVAVPPDEELGPRLLLDDGTQSIYLADLSGDGLTDVVRIRNGEVCYWPNLGYGHFGAKVTMDNAPWFDHAEQFDQRRIRLADFDGSGTSDIVYLGGDSVRLYCNQSGNRWSEARILSKAPSVDNLGSITTADLLGNGTTCLVWSSPLPSDVRRPLRYIDLMGGKKPHLLKAMFNNLGAETHVEYASSTKFYLADKLTGTPWVTRLPFPVHVVERVETVDRIGRNRFVTRYAYHHGHFDGVEREFRGFGRVEQLDTEEFASLTAGGTLPEVSNIDGSSHVPPILTKTWLHTGVYLGRETISTFFAGMIGDTGEYYREPSFDDAQAGALLLDDTVMPAKLTIDEEREACRALKGAMLRQEIYALDGTALEKLPYTVTEQNFTIRPVQPRADNRHAVFFVHARESLGYHYERSLVPVRNAEIVDAATAAVDPNVRWLQDPRVSHTLTLEVDPFGTVLKSATIGYGRRYSDLRLPTQQDRDKQTRIHFAFSETRVTNAVDEQDDYRAPQSYQLRNYEVTGVPLQAEQPRFTLEQVMNAGTTATPLDYEKAPTPGALEKRLIEHVRTLYRKDDLSGPLQLGKLESRGLTFERYKLALTPALATQVYGSRVTASQIENEGRYVHSQDEAGTADNFWWIPTGRIFFSPDSADTAAQELDFARVTFFLPVRSRDPFHSTAVSTESFITYDPYRLLVEESRDPFGSRVTVGERALNPALPLVSRGHDYRVLQPALTMDPNRNRSQVVFDALGMVAGTAVMGKPEDNPVPGDRLSAAFRPDLTQAEVDQFFANPKGSFAVALLGDASSRCVYDLTCYANEPDPTKKRPAFAACLERASHVSDPLPLGALQLQYSFSYSDGLGREIQKKMQAEAGPVPSRDASGILILNASGGVELTPNDVAPRWVGTGWTILNNKGKPVRQYEAFFTDTHRFEFDVRMGVSPVAFYDPTGRVVGTALPNHTWEKAVFEPWRQESWSTSDTVLVPDPKTDSEVGDFFKRLPDTEYLPTWFSQRQGGALGAEEQAAALKAAVHARTPAVLHADSLGRAFLTVAHNVFKYSDRPAAELPVIEQHATRVVLDVEGNQREVLDANDRVIMRYAYDMLGHRIHQASMESGQRWMLGDVASRPIYAWDLRGHRFRTEYDRLRRPTDSFLKEGNSSEELVERNIYGESLANPEANNQRGKVVQVLDQAGVLSFTGYDFKGNLLGGQRQLATNYTSRLNWSSAVALEATIFSSVTRFDALNRPIELTSPDGSRVRPAFNEASLLDRIDVNLEGAVENGQPVWTPFVRDIAYDATGRRTLIDYGNGVRTTYAYDPLTFRLVRLTSRRDPTTFPTDCPQPPPSGSLNCQAQNIQFTYDAAGNLTDIRDGAQQTLYFANTLVDPSAQYNYDAVGRLIEATGREHLGQVNGTPIPHGYNDAPRVGQSHPNDGNAMGRYRERYVYDPVGNLLSMEHRGGAASAPSWTRAFAFNETSQLEPAKQNNRLTSSIAGASPETYTVGGNGYDSHGNMLRLPHLQALQWNFQDQLQMTQRQAVNTSDSEGVQRNGERTYYVYDGQGQRIRKVTELQGGQLKDERIYLGRFEIYRRAGAQPLVRKTLHIMDDRQRIALVETRVSGTEPGVPQQQIRYQFSNHLGSSTLELNDQAQIVSYEEYTPWGSTSYQATQTQVPKRYRFTGKERDEESGLGYYGARYYAAWLARWTSCDPMSVGEGPNLYVYARCRPTTLTDKDGKQATAAEILDEHDVIYGIMTHQRPGDAATWWAQGPKANPSEWAGELSAWERRYVTTFTSTPIDPVLRMRRPVDPANLTAEESAESRRLFGASAGAARQYANYETRRRILAHYVYTHPATIQLQLGLYRLFRDVNPIHFAFERGWQVGSGREMFTGEQVSRLGAAAEFFTALALGYLMGRALRAVRPPIGTPGAGQTLAGLQDDVLREAVAARARALSTQGNPLYLSNTQRGPVLTGVMDTTTGEVFFGLNEGVPANLHPILQARLQALLARGPTAVRAGIPGSHSEVNALNRALRAFETRTGRAATEADLGNFSYHNRSLRGVNRAEGVPPPCSNCEPMVQGTGAVE